MIAGWCGIACLAGVVSSQLMCKSIRCRDAIGVMLERGHLLALTHGHGIYEADAQREIEQLRFASNDEEIDLRDAKMRGMILSRLIANTTARYLARHERISKAKLDREFSRIQFQFRDPSAWTTELAASHLSSRALRSEIESTLRVEEWMERQLAAMTKVGDAECAEYFNTHPEISSLPARFRASHLFLAAPPGTESPIVGQKRRTIDSLSVRLSHGEDFSELVGLTSEDEATKTRGGDLGFFSGLRMPADFFSAIEKMQSGEVGPPLQTRLGFHIVQMNDSRPARTMTLEEMRPEIRRRLEDVKRREAIQELTMKLSEEADFVAPRL